jgi:hypothetical protein
MISELDFSRNNTIKNPDDKQTSPVSDPEFFLKSRIFLRQIVSLTHTIFQTNSTRSNIRGILERSISLPLSIDTFSFHEVYDPTTERSDEFPMYLDLTPVDSSIYSSYKSGETSSLILGLLSLVPYALMIISTQPFYHIQVQPKIYQASLRFLLIHSKFQPQIYQWLCTEVRGQELVL